MALVSFPGSPLALIGPGLHRALLPGLTSVTMDAANESVALIGRVATSDEASHTIDTTGSSSLGFRTGAVTFANAGTTLKVGIAAVDAGAGPPARAANAADVITFDVNAAPVGGSGTITANAWHTIVPTAGTKTVAHGDMVAFAVQMTARGGADSVVFSNSTADNSLHRPVVTSFTGGAYAPSGSVPNAIITFSDGALGYFYAGEVFSAISTRTWNSGGATTEYGQLYQLPFPTKVYGLWGFVDPDADTDVVLYSDPLGTPVAEKTISIDSNIVTTATGRKFYELFSSPYTTAANQLIASVFKPGGSNISAYYRTMASATHRVADQGGTTGYGISRASGAFANANSSLDHYYIGLIVGAFDDATGGGATGGAHILGGTVVR
jgi:hypothetical protein